MGAFEDFGAALDALKKAVGDASAKIKALRDLLAAGGLDAAQEAAVLKDMGDIAAALEAAVADPVA